MNQHEHEHKHEHEHHEDAVRQIKLSKRWGIAILVLFLAFFIGKPLLVSQLISRVHSYMGYGMNNDVIRVANTLLLLEPKNATAWNCEGQAWQIQKLFPQAIAAYKNGIAANPNNRIAYFNLGLIAVFQNDLDSGATWFEHVRAIGPETKDELSVEGYYSYYKGALQFLLAYYQKQGDQEKQNTMQEALNNIEAPTKPVETSFKIVTSFYPIYIMAINLVKNIPGVAVTNLTPASTGCLHDYSVTPDDLKKLAGTQIFIANGAGMEAFLNKIIAQYPALPVAKLDEGIPLLKASSGSGANPHLWLSISDAILQVKNLEKVLEKADPVHQVDYAKNSTSYIAKLEALRQKMHHELASYKGVSIITFHEAFPYFASEFGLKIAAVIEREPGSEPSAKALSDTVKLIKIFKIKALFSEPAYPASAINVISKETGLKVYTLDPAVTGPDDKDAYLNIMERNLISLKAALK